MASVCWLALAGRSQSIGSANLDQPPRSPRLTATIQTPSYSPSSGGYYTYSSSTPPPNRPRKTSYAGESATLQVPGPGSPWKRKFSKKVKDFMGSPRFHRRRMDGEGPVWLPRPLPAPPLLLPFPLSCPLTPPPLSLPLPLSTAASEVIPESNGSPPM